MTCPRFERTLCDIKVFPINYHFPSHPAPKKESAELQMYGKPEHHARLMAVACLIGKWLVTAQTLMAGFPNWDVIRLQPRLYFSEACRHSKLCSTTPSLQQA
ncbi:hypothetical protein DFH09DRAFT_1100567 [Mycena vulgaris]|nr:hypothetical protein DFH09DRAFT_1100567 [Mycena vulgaris]